MPEDFATEGYLSGRRMIKAIMGIQHRSLPIYGFPIPSRKYQDARWAQDHRKVFVKTSQKDAP